MSNTMTVDQALARIMELHKTSPGEDILRPELREVLSAVRSDGYSTGYEDGREDGVNA